MSYDTGRFIKILRTTCILIGWTWPSFYSSPLDSSSNLLSYDVVLFESKESISCVAAGKDLQTAMIFPLENEAVSSFVPKTYYSCTFRKSEACTKKWVEKGWIWITSYRFKSRFVFDRRWEKFPLKTGRTYTYNEPFTFNKEVDDISGDHFEIPISVKAKMDVNLFLCDERSDHNISTSSCYWFIIGGRKGQMSEIRKCSGVEGQQVPSLNNLLSCENSKTHYNHTLHNTTYPLDSSEWKHFKIKKEKNLLYVIRPNDCDKYLEWKDEEGTPYNVKNFFVSLRGYGGYKIHRYGIIFTREEISFSFDELREYHNGNEFCMAILFYMYPSFKLNFVFTYVNGGKDFVEVGSKNGWHEYVIRRENENIEKMEFVTKGGKNKVWVLSEVRSCSQKDVRVIRGPTKNKECVLLNEEDGGQFSISANFRPQLVQYQSSSDTFDIGNQTYPCSVLGNANSETCGSAKICRQDSGQVRCSCTWGYYLGNDHCFKRCEKFYFGFNCKESCGCCKYTSEEYHNECMHETGKCPGDCCKGFKGQYCHETSVISNLKQIGENTTQIKLTWDVLTNSQTSDYKINYAHVKYNACQNKNSPITGSLEAKGPVIDGLLPYSTYQVNVTVFYIKQQNKEVVSDTLEAELVTSPTAAVSDEERPEVSLEVTHESVIITPQVNCQIVKGLVVYSINIFCTNEWCQRNNDYIPYATTEGRIIINRLIPYSNYKMNIKIHRVASKESINLQEESFTTKPSAPNPVRDLVAYSTSGESIFLRWKPPYPPNGELENMEVTQNNTIIKTIEPRACKIWKAQQCIQVSGIQANSWYRININPKNRGVETRTSSKSIQIQAKSLRPEPPKDISAYFDDEDKLHVKWEHPEKTNGELTQFNLYFRASGKNNSNQKIATETYSEKLHFEKVVDNFTWPYHSSLIVECSAQNSAEESLLAQTEITTPPERPVFENKPIGFPKISDTSVSITYPIQNVLIRRDVSSSSSIILFGGSQKPNGRAEADEKLKKICQVEDRVAWVEPSSSKSESNPPSIDVVDLEPGTSYGVCVVLRNSFISYTRYSTTTSTFRTSEDTPITEVANPALYSLVLLILLVPLLLWMLWRKKKTNNRVPENPETFPLNPIEKDRSESERPEKYSKPVGLHELEKYIQDAIISKELESQFNLFPMGQTKPWICGMQDGNVFKNRYKNLAAYDHTRVILDKINGDDFSDYINANYIQGYNNPKAYIATQGPKPTTVHDFWRMIWKENVQHIVMLTNIVEGETKKLEQYWPNLNASQTYGDISVTFAKSRPFGDFEDRTLVVQKREERREICHLHFVSWPDFGVPLHLQSLLQFCQKLQTLSQNTPIVVHCCSGMGRTGTMILTDICLRAAAKEGKVDVQWQLHQLREQRAYMVANVEQYKLVHLLLTDSLFAPTTSIECDKNFKENVRKVCQNEFNMQLRYLQKAIWLDQVVKIEVEEDYALEFPDKNRFQRITPAIKERIYIPRIREEGESSEYINAVKADGFLFKNKYIVTQRPLPNTVGDFWRMIVVHGSRVIVSLNDVPEEDPSCPKFWPTEESPEMLPASFIVLQHVKTIQNEIFDTLTIRVCNKNTKKNEKALVDVILFKNWPFEKFVPDKAEYFLTLCEEVDKLPKIGRPVVVTCYDGARASGLFAAATFMIEKMKLEQQCDVCLAVRVIRHNRTHFVQNREQFRYLYELAVAYISSVETYSNFI